MPIKDTIDLVKFLADISFNSSRFVPGAQEWIQRKHYYDKDLNLTTTMEDE